MNADGRDFAIDGELLAADAGGWRNLGLWPPTPQENAAPADYRHAAAALARTVGEAAALTAGDSVLELACGHGEGLALWLHEFGVSDATGLDCQRDCIAALPAGQGVYGRFDVLPLPDGIGAGSHDAVLCVDAAYHATSLTAFAAVAASALRPGGRLAFTTLMARDSLADKPAPLRRGLQRLLATAKIPAASLADAATLRATLASAGFTGIRVQRLDAAVLDGFADYIDRRTRELPWQARLRPAWFKIRLTAALCRQVQAQGLLHYALVSARLDTGTASTDEGFSRSIGSQASFTTTRATRPGAKESPMPRICLLHALPAAYATSVKAGDFGHLGEPEATLELGIEWEALTTLLGSAGMGATGGFLSQGERLHAAQPYPALHTGASVQIFAQQLQTSGVDALTAHFDAEMLNRLAVPPGNWHADHQSVIAARLRALANFVSQAAAQQQCIVIAIEDY